MNYYHDLITQESWKELKTLNKEITFVLIGGWATYLYTKELKSKDIDMLVEYGELGKLKKEYDVVKNERLKKYEARRGGVQIDMYLPHFSSIGIPVEVLMNNSRSLEGFRVLEREWLMCLKIYVLGVRGRTPKGEKDFLDILSLFKTKTYDAWKLKTILKTYNFGTCIDVFSQLLSERTHALEIGLNDHFYKKLKVDIVSFIKCL
ncbi:MAG: hypothetical protein NT149_03810 [Candidatus Gottesmanbacteria bacterium]|nr:hypothetical protein [Candidatus Gottesmanbacteria bacterium]